jgi:glycerate 2-kinase
MDCTASGTEPAPVRFLLDLYAQALAAADPMAAVPPHLPERPRGRTIVVGAGKAAAAMARAVEAHWDGPLEGVVVAPEGAKLPTRSIAVVESSHPVPDERSVHAAALLELAVTGLSEDDLVIALISGGGSSLCSAPAAGLTLQAKQLITRALLRSGATIAEINTVRRHLSAIKGGRLAARAFPARVHTLLISDIPGDIPELIASGPTLADPSTCEQAMEILDRYGVDDLGHVKAALRDGLWESVKPDDPRLRGHSHAVVASAGAALSAAAELARGRGYACHVLSDAMEGEAKDLATAHAAIALQVARRGEPFQAPCVILSGGEATVTLRGRGRGGRNTEFVLAFALAMESQPTAPVYALSVGTDGLDGTASAAGAWTGPGLIRAGTGVDVTAARASLHENDSATFLGRVGALVHTGPTFTNVNDFRAIVIGTK